MWIVIAMALIFTGGYLLGLGRERYRWQRRADATRLGIVRSLGRDVADRPDAIGRAVIRPASYRRTRWGGDR